VTTTEAIDQTQDSLHASNVIDDAAAAQTPAITIEDVKPIELPDEIEELLPSQLVLDDDSQVRRFKVLAKDVADLAKDILLNGQIQPILYRVIDEKKVVIDGHTRVMAVEHINTTHNRRMKVKAMKVDMSDARAFLAGAAANIKRFEMSPIDYARVIHVMTAQHGMMKKDVATALGRSNAWVTEMSKMADFRPHVQKLIHDRKIGYTEAREMFEMTEAEQDEYIKERTEAASTGGKKKGYSREAARAKRRKKAPADQSVALTIRETREVLRNLAGVGKDFEEAQKKEEAFECKYSDRVQTVAAAMLKMMDGKLGEKALANKIDAA